MKTGQVIKAFENGVTDKELELINQYSRKTMTKDEVYVFSVVLCDNDIDRDYERFTVEALFELEKLFVGKTGIFDHAPKAENQSARIISCKVENIDTKKTASGDDYFRLVARAYIPRTKKNEDLIEQIEAGIVKEVSVSCSVEKVLCSICSNEINSAFCTHQKGECYADSLCFGELSGVKDAYEFSFVAVPAQRGAGVIKAYSKNGKDMNMNDILKSIKESDSLTLKKEELKTLYSYIKGLEEMSVDAKMYREELEKSVFSLSMENRLGVEKEILKSMISKLSTKELKALHTALENREKDIADEPQLFSKSDNKQSAKNTQFTI